MQINGVFTARLNSFKTAVEAYDVEGMLDFLAKEIDSDKILTIAEEGFEPYDKDYATLENELMEDEGKQRWWRKAPSEGGYGYTLTMELGATIFSNITASGAYVRVYFAIKEAAQVMEEQITDYDHMVCAMVKNQGIWRCQKMTINFYDPAKSANPVSSAPMVARGRTYQTRTGTRAVRGFSFGVIDIQEGISHKHNGD